MSKRQPAVLQLLAVFFCACLPVPQFTSIAFTGQLSAASWT